MLFSKELPWCCFCAEIKVLGMTWKFTRIFCGIYKKYWRKNQPEGWSWEPTSPPCAGPLVAHVWLVGPTLLHRLQSHLYLVPFIRKKIKEKSSSRFTIRRRRHLLFFIWRADLESVLGSGEGKSSPSSSSTFFPLQFHEALHCSWVIYS